jgi:hypothetical protein
MTILEYLMVNTKKREGGMERSERFNITAIKENFNGGPEC